MTPFINPLLPGGVLSAWHNVYRHLKGTNDMFGERFITSQVMGGLTREQVLDKYKPYVDEYTRNGQPSDAGLKHHLLSLKENNKYIIMTLIKDSYELFDYTVKEEGLEDAICYKSQEAFNMVHSERKEPSMILVIFDLSKVK